MLNVKYEKQPVVVDQSLIYSGCPKMFLLFFSLILSLTLNLSQFICWFRFRFDFYSWIYWNSVIDFPLLVNLVFPFLIHNEINASQFKPKGHNYLNLPSQLYKLMLVSVISLSAHMFLFCFYLWLYIHIVTSFNKDFVNVFSIDVHVFCNLFREVCPLFRKILITCLKSSRPSFLLSSCSEKYFVRVFLQLHKLNLTYSFKSSLLLAFCFLFICLMKIKCTHHRSHHQKCFRGYVILRG